MANTYSQAIEIRLKVEQLNRELTKLEQRLKKIQQVNVKLTSVQAAATEAQRLQDNVQKGVSAVKKLEQGFRSVLTSALLMTGLFDKHLGSLEKELKVMKDINTYFKNYSAGLDANIRSLNSIDRALRGVDNAWGRITYNVDVYERLAKRQVELEKTRAVILRRQADAIRRQRQEQETLYANARRNVRISGEARGGSGFREFSQAAGGAVRRRVEEDRRAERAAIEDIERLRETKALNSYNTAQRRKKYLAKLDQENIDEYFRAENARIRNVEKAERDAAKRSARLRESLLLGAGFPLLFGGGAGAVGGGLLGSLLGDGFGGQIFLSALGTQLDQLSLFTQNLAKSFREGGDAAGFLEQTLGYLDPTTKRLLSNLQESGQTAAAAAEAQRILAEEIGVAGANALRRAGEQSDQYTRSLKKLGLEFYASALAASQFFQNLRGDFGRIPGVAAPVQEEPTTQAAQARLADLKKGNALLQEQAKLSGLSRKNDAEGYAIQQKRIARQEYQNTLDGIARDLDEGKITLAERAELKTRAKFTLTKAINTAETQLNDTRQRAAEEQERKQQQLADKAAKASTTATALTTKLQRQLELATAKTDEDKKALRILFDYEDSVEAIRKLEDQSQASRQMKLADEVYSVQLNKLAADELERYLKTLTSIAVVSPGLGRQAFRGTALQGAVQTDVGLAFGTQANLAEATPEDIQLQKAKDRLEELIAPINQVKTAAEGIGSAFTDSFKSVINGTATTQEALANMFSRIADAFFDMAAQIITQMLVIKAIESAINIFGGGGTFKGFSGQGPVAFPSNLNIGVAGFKANGGSVSAGSPYVVGEKGPELFVPGKSGTIVPNNALGGNKVEVGTINISVENTGEDLSPVAQKRIANQVQGIVMATLVNERRSGGVLR